MCAQPNQRFTFVSFTNPEEAKKKDTKKRVRSVAAFSGWDQRLNRPPDPEPQTEIKVEDTMRYEDTSSTLPELPPPRIQSDRSKGKQPSEDLQPAAGPAEHLAHQYLQNYEHFFGQTPFFQIQEPQWPHPRQFGCVECTRRGITGPCRCAEAVFIPTAASHGAHKVSKSTKKRTFTKNDIIAARLAPLMETLANPQTPERISGGKFDPFGSYPVPAEPWYDWVLHHSKTSCSPFSVINHSQLQC